MKQLILGVFVLSLFSCNQQEDKKTSTPNYFDVAGYFKQEAVRLQKFNPTIHKIVSANGKNEQKNTHITNWETELTSFSSADINKASWKGEFTETLKNDNSLSYTTNNPKIPIKKIEIIKNHHQIKGIKIFKLTNNYLYTSTDTLLYYPDSLYFIRSEQKIKLLSKKIYQIKGEWK
ncbi:hypothetical protein [Pedobacter sp. UBA4863]|uniref:hypothetical protein n=1 Tax=Pedobacter sp. UBA4863 TaxID=1947060 RepID=UPI0025EC1291|nr:hypothetical protein [Pedobacter sp. UBA4863]